MEAPSLQLQDQDHTQDDQDLGLELFGFRGAFLPNFGCSDEELKKNRRRLEKSRHKNWKGVYGLYPFFRPVVFKTKYRVVRRTRYPFCVCGEIAEGVRGCCSANCSQFKEYRSGDLKRTYKKVCSFCYHMLKNGNAWKICQTESGCCSGGIETYRPLCFTEKCNNYRDNRGEKLCRTCRLCSMITAHSTGAGTVNISSRALIFSNVHQNKWVTRGELYRMAGIDLDIFMPQKKICTKFFFEGRRWIIVDAENLTNDAGTIVGSRCCISTLVRKPRIYRPLRFSVGNHIKITFKLSE